MLYNAEFFLRTFGKLIVTNMHYISSYFLLHMPVNFAVHFLERML